MSRITPAELTEILDRLGESRPSPARVVLTWLAGRVPAEFREAVAYVEPLSVPRRDVPVRELAAALRSALDVPFAAHPADLEATRDLRVDRVAWTAALLERLAETGDVDAAIRSARRAADAYPVTYPVRDGETGGGS